MGKPRPLTKGLKNRGVPIGLVSIGSDCFQMALYALWTIGRLKSGALPRIGTTATVVSSRGLFYT
jgi:hypothetical protein